MLSDAEIVEAFFEAIYRLDFDAAVEFFTEDASYHDLPLPTDPSSTTARSPPGASTGTATSS